MCMSALTDLDVGPALVFRHAVGRLQCVPVWISASVTALPRTLLKQTTTTWKSSLLNPTSAEFPNRHNNNNFDFNFVYFINSIEMRKMKVKRP